MQDMHEVLPTLLLQFNVASSMLMGFMLDLSLFIALRNLIQRHDQRPFLWFGEKSNTLRSLQDHPNLRIPVTPQFPFPQRRRDQSDSPQTLHMLGCCWERISCCFPCWEAAHYEVLIRHRWIIVWPGMWVKVLVLVFLRRYVVLFYCKRRRGEECNWLNLPNVFWVP